MTRCEAWKPNGSSSWHMGGVRTLGAQLCGQPENHPGNHVPLIGTYDPTTAAIEAGNTERERLKNENTELLGLLQRIYPYIDQDSEVGKEIGKKLQKELTLEQLFAAIHYNLISMRTVAIAAHGSGHLAVVDEHLTLVNMLFDRVRKLSAELETLRAVRGGPPACCEVTDCTKQVMHGEHHYNRIRFWCKDHVPMSGHHEWCPEPCTHLVAKYVTPSPSMLGRGEIG